MKGMKVKVVQENTKKVVIKMLITNRSFPVSKKDFDKNFKKKIARQSFAIKTYHSPLIRNG